MGWQASLQTYNEMAEIGFDALKTRQIELGRQVRELMESYGFKSLAAEGFKSPTVVVSHTDRADLKMAAHLRLRDFKSLQVFRSSVANRLIFKPLESVYLGWIS